MDFSREDHVYIMGILNATPDSFSNDGILAGGNGAALDSTVGTINADDLKKHVEAMIEDGADIIDVGGESTRPGHIQISSEEEIARVCDVIKIIRSEFDIPISIDTYKAEVAKEALSAGADIVNDIWGCRYEMFNPSQGEMSDRAGDEMSDFGGSSRNISRLAKVTAEAGAYIVLMHNDNLGRTLEERTPDKFKEDGYVSSDIYEPVITRSEAENVVLRVMNGLKNSVEIALAEGIARDKIILDPGVGFAKTQEENMKTLAHLADFRELGYPFLLGASRKSVIGNALDLPVREREEGTITTSILSAEAGARFVRVHNVKANRRALDMWEAINAAKSM